MTNDAMRGLIERAIPIIETERECLFEGHHVNGVVEIIDEADQVSVDAMAEMDAWLTDARSIISQPEQPAIGDEPVCWINEDLFSEMEKYDGPGVGKAGVLWNCETDRKCTKKRIPLYAAPPPLCPTTQHHLMQPMIRVAGTCSTPFWRSILMQRGNFMRSNMAMTRPSRMSPVSFRSTWCFG